VSTGSWSEAALGGTVAAVPVPLKLSFTVVYEDVEDGWVMARVLEMPGAISQGRTREEARDNVRDALRELLLRHSNESAREPPRGQADSIEVTIAP
jgi:predicted RNase H-like HicB family nuclease